MSNKALLYFTLICALLLCIGYGFKSVYKNRVSKAEMRNSEAHAGRMIYHALLLAANDKDGKFPGDLETLYPRYLENANLLYQPGTQQLRWQLTPGLENVSNPNIIVLESINEFFKDGTKVKVVITVDGAMTFVPVEKIDRQSHRIKSP